MIQQLYVEVWDKFSMHRADAYPGSTVGPFKNEADAYRFSQGLDSSIGEMNSTARTTSSPDDPSRVTPAPNTDNFFNAGVQFGKTLVRKHEEYSKSFGEPDYLYWQRFRDRYGY